MNNNNHDLRWIKRLLYFLDEVPIQWVWAFAMIVLAFFTLFGKPDGTALYLQQQGVPLFCQASTWFIGSIILIILRKYDWSFFLGTLPLAMFVIVTLAACIAHEQWSLRPVFYCLLLYMLNREYYGF
jgi:hypothetical protein